MVRALLKGGAEIDERWEIENNETALIIAALNNPNPEVVSALLNGGAEVDARARDGSTALMYAAGTNPNPEVVRALLKGGADVNAVRGKDGTMALMCTYGFFVHRRFDPYVYLVLGCT